MIFDQNTRKFTEFEALYGVDIIIRTLYNPNE